MESAGWRWRVGGGLGGGVGGVEGGGAKFHGSFGFFQKIILMFLE